MLQLCVDLTILADIRTFGGPYIFFQILFTMIYTLSKNEQTLNVRS